MKILIMNITLFIILFVTKNLCYCKKYDNYILYRGIPVLQTHLEFFNNLSNQYEINFWRPPGMLYKPVEFVLKPEDKENFIALANQYGIYLTTLIPDIQTAFDRQTVKAYIRRKMETFDWMHYFRLDDIYNWLYDLSKIYPDVMTLDKIGTTYENRQIIAVRITLIGSKRRSKVFIEGGIHAREWISPAFVTFMIYQILHAPDSTNQMLRDIALTYDWFFVPVLNPDGYEYTHTADRMWRKNRNKNYYGVDLNRNFGFRFGSVGVSRDKKSEIYCGPHPFSENESLAMRQFVEKYSENLEYYISFHAYGQYMIIPYAHSKKHLDNYNVVHKMASQASIALATRYKTSYSVGTAYDTVGYVTSGVSTCWVKSSYRVPYAVTFELRDDGRYGFALPPELILPTCLETMDGVLSLLQPRTKRFTKLILDFHDDGQRTVFDKMVLFCNVLLFFIVRFD